MDIEKEIRSFLDEICVDLGFCLPPKDIKLLASRESYEVDQFVRDIFLAEDMNPDLELNIFRQVKRKFTDRFGSEI